MIAMLLLAAASPASWVITEQRDPITDINYATASLSGDNGMLALRCDASSDRALYVAIQSPNYNGGSVSRYAAYRFDGKPAVESYWSGEFRYAYSMKPRDVHAFLDALPGSRKVVVQVYDAAGKQFNISFDNPVDVSAIERIRAICVVPIKK